MSKVVITITIEDGEALVQELKEGSVPTKLAHAVLAWAGVGVEASENRTPGWTRRPTLKSLRRSDVGAAALKAQDRTELVRLLGRTKKAGRAVRREARNA